MDKVYNKRKREQESSPGSLNGPPEKKPSNSVADLPQRSSSPQPSTSGANCGEQQDVQQKAQKRRRRQREQRERRRRLREGYFDVEIVLGRPRPSVRIPTWVPPATAAEVMAEVWEWWTYSPYRAEM